MLRKHTTIAISWPLKRELDELQDELNVCLKGSGNRLATKDQLLSYMLDCAHKHLLPA